MGALAENVDDVPGLAAPLKRAHAADRTTLIAIKVDPDRATEAGGHWWDVAVPEVSDSAKVREAYAEYRRLTDQQIVDG